MSKVESEPTGKSANFLELQMRSPSATESFAHVVAEFAAAGDHLLLKGQIGTGKTVFARALIKAKLCEFGLDEDVPSPTYNLVQIYVAGGLEIWHADLYRISDPGEAAELGLDDALEFALCIIEWPERLGDSDWPRGTCIEFCMDESSGCRRLAVDARSRLGKQVIARIRQSGDEQGTSD